MKKNDILNMIIEAIEGKESKVLDNKIITFEVHNDYDGDIENLINAIAHNSEDGHSFEVVVDPNKPERRGNYEKRFHIDGDGGTSIKNIKIESLEKEDIEESVFLIDPDDDNLQTKIKTIKNNSSIFNPDSDTIKIKDDADNLNMTEGNGGKRYKNDDQLTQDYMKTIKKANREIEYDIYGDGWRSVNKAHKNKKKYDRSKFKKDTKNSMDETVLTKKDVDNIIIERKYNGKLFTKDELLKKLKKD